MNARTARLLRLAARAAGVSEREAVRNWERLSPRQRAKERRQLQRIAAQAERLRLEGSGIQDAIAQVVKAERTKRAESRIVRGDTRLVLP